MIDARYFNSDEKACVNKTFARAQKLTEKHFNLSEKDWNIHKYDVKTLAYLKDYEINNKAFAHLCKYHYQKKDDRDLSQDFHFYRICLQDNRILNAVNRGDSFIRFFPLMLYIATHELVHILRFNKGECDFDMPFEEREREEDRVHRITRDLLTPVANSELNLVLECFSNDYRIGDLFN